MSRYVLHKHGLRLGSGNMFYVYDGVMDELSGEPPLVMPEGVSDQRDGYNAIVSLERYSFDQYNSLNVRVRTPAHQIIFEKHLLEWTREYDDGDKILQLPMRKNYNVLRNWVERWLNENVGAKYEMWDTYTRSTSANESIFFKRRKDALAFIGVVGDLLAGISIKKE